MQRTACAAAWNLHHPWSAAAPPAPAVNTIRQTNTDRKKDAVALVRADKQQELHYLDMRE
jgi:hypothetical protein